MPTETKLDTYKKTGRAIRFVSTHAISGSVITLLADAYWLHTGIVAFVAGVCSILAFVGQIATRENGFFAAEKVKRRALLRSRKRFLKECKVTTRISGKLRPKELSE